MGVLLKVGVEIDVEIRVEIEVGIGVGIVILFLILQMERTSEVLRYEPKLQLKRHQPAQQKQQAI